MRFIIGVTIFAIYTLSSFAAQNSWPEWEQFKNTLISQDGRVIDTSSTQMISTSEGQSYAMFFALVANDRATFDSLLAWTENNLAKGNFDQPIAWLWGRSNKGQWQILDENTAVDANLWIAYDLLEAGRIWGDKRYSKKGYAILHSLKKDIMVVPMLGTILLPGKEGFKKKKGYILNPSYFPPQVMRRLASINQTWQRLDKDSYNILIQTSPNGYAPDWALWNTEQQKWQPKEKKKAIGSYDAIRVYLWAGMMAESKQKTQLVAHFQPFIALVSKNTSVPTFVDWQTGKISGKAPLGFSAAMLPIMSNNSQCSQLLQSISAAEIKNMGYYNAVLVLYGKGWYDKRYRFDKNGHLMPMWFQASLGIED